jgi:23S rRNA (pseudouridine1915-N3)-methyltransferase
MLKIKIIVVDKTRTAFLREGESFYLDRLRQYVHVDWEEVKPAKITKGKSDKEVLDAEAESLARRISSKEYVVALDRAGDTLDPQKLALWLEHLSRKAQGGVSFLIGGPLGLSSTLLAKSQRILSLSRFTLTHEMSRLLLLEQLYRAMTILKGEKYHK